MKTYRVVTAFIVKGDKVLILRRSSKVGTYRGRWSGISGYLEDLPLKQAYREISEELSLPKEDLQLLATGDPITVVDDNLGVRWIVYPFLFKFMGEDNKLKLDWENMEAKWVRPEEIRKFKTVPDLYRVLKNVWNKAYPSPL